MSAQPAPAAARAKPTLRMAWAVCVARSPAPMTLPCSSIDTCPAVYTVRVPVAATTCENDGLSRSPSGQGCSSLLICQVCSQAPEDHMRCALDTWRAQLAEPGDQIPARGSTTV